MLTLPQVFNVGQLRRTRAKEQAEKNGVKQSHNANFFSHDNAAATQSRDSLAEDSLEMLITWLKQGGGNVGIHGTCSQSLHETDI